MKLIKATQSGNSEKFKIMEHKMKINGKSGFAVSILNF